MSASVGSRRAGSKAWGGWAAVVAVVLLAAGCGKTSERKDVAVAPILDTVTGTLTDMRDRKTYRTVVIGQQRWMAENLNFVTDSSVCYDNADSNCVKYGRLYTWDDAMKVCPTGWLVPSDDDWDSLVVAVGGQRDDDYLSIWKYAGKKLKSTTGWNDWKCSAKHIEITGCTKGEEYSGNGTDEIGFSALPGGYRWSGGTFGNVGSDGYWWSATEDGAMYARARTRYMISDISNVYWDYFGKSQLYSVRCIEGAAPSGQTQSDVFH